MKAKIVLCRVAIREVVVNDTSTLVCAISQGGLALTFQIALVGCQHI